MLAAAIALMWAAPADAQWRRLDSPNFVLIGDVSASAIREVAVRFEAFREVLGRVLGQHAVASPVPTVVVVFSTEYGMEPFRPKFKGKPVDVAGLFVPGRDINYIALVNDGSEERMRAVLHEYVHLSTANARYPLPLWLSEGLAELYSTFEILRNGREATLGRLINEHLARLNDTILIPLADLLAMRHDSPLYNEGSRRGVLYAQSWALTHLILLGEPGRQNELNIYLQRLAGGATQAEAWEAFGDVDMQALLEAYVRRAQFRGYTYKFADAIAKLQAQPVSIPLSDAHAYLAGLLTQLGEHDAAAARLAQSRKLDPRNPRHVVGEVMLSIARAAPGEPIAAVEDLRADSSADWLTSYLAGVALAEAASRGGQEPAPATIDAIARWLAEARKGGGDYPNAVVRLAMLELRSPAGSTAETVAALDAARERSGGRPDFAFVHAQVLSRRGEYDKAREVIAPLTTSAYPIGVRERAREVLKQVLYMQFPQMAREAAAADAAAGGSGAGATGGGASGAGGAGATGGAPDARRSVPIFRQLQPGEQRSEGVLSAIDCVDGKGVSFTVKSGEIAVTASAPQLSDVTFTTFRDDVGGSVQCGALKVPMPVYLTWRPAADGTGRVAVAVEFLPRK